ncbi:phosphoglucosamine mutase [bacterium]|nr:phosphoglucosamine mutase [bacterium]NBX72227.1 phosphoglucosamine mutase [bacterium]
MSALFGTDGIRATVGCYPVTPESFLQLGWALGSWIGSGKVLIGKDTRLSGYMLESALEAGLAAAGIDVYLTGPLPTPAIAYLTQSLNAQAGLVISASHNPFYDNGLKIFSSDGLKLTTEQQNNITSFFQKKITVATSYELGKAHRLNDAAGRYIEFLKSHFSSLDLSGISIILDCAHGAAYQIAPELFKELRANVQVINDQPNGYNINKNAGVMDLDLLEKVVHEQKPKFAFAFDGDADRLVAYVNGKKINPNHILLVLYDYYQLRGMSKTGIAMTCLTNLGVQDYCSTQGIAHVSTDVGDRNLIYACLQYDWTIAGEPSGHYLLMDKLKTADALLTALALVDYFIRTEKTAEYFEKKAPLYPSLIHNFHINDPKTVLSKNHITESLEKIKKNNPSERVIIRASGTEPVIRIYAEGKNLSTVEEIIKEAIAIFEKYKEDTTGIVDEKVLAH